eukprot:609366-Rhodomonas_salina.1
MYTLWTSCRQFDDDLRTVTMAEWEWNNSREWLGVCNSAQLYHGSTGPQQLRISSQYNQELLGKASRHGQSQLSGIRPTPIFATTGSSKFFYVMASPTSPASLSQTGDG